MKDMIKGSKLAKFFVLITVVCLASTLFLVGCGGSGSSTDTSQKADWEVFLDDYEVFADKYADLMKKYKENPTDQSIVKEFQTLGEEALEWQNRAQSLDTKSMSADDQKKFAEEAQRIGKKITSAMS